MKVKYKPNNSEIKLYNGDCLEVMKGLPELKNKDFIKMCLTPQSWRYVYYAN